MRSLSFLAALYGVVERLLGALPLIVDLVAEDRSELANSLLDLHHRMFRSLGGIVVGEVAGVRRCLGMLILIGGRINFRFARCRRVVINGISLRRFVGRFARFGVGGFGRILGACGLSARRCAWAARGLVGVGRIVLRGRAIGRGLRRLLYENVGGLRLSARIGR